jgi:hypothetical protein
LDKAGGFSGEAVKSSTSSFIVNAYDLFLCALFFRLNQPPQHLVCGGAERRVKRVLPA